MITASSNRYFPVPVNSVSSSVGSTLPVLIQSASCSSVVPAWWAASRMPYILRSYHGRFARKVLFAQAVPLSLHVPRKLHLTFNFVPDTMHNEFVFCADEIVLTPRTVSIYERRPARGETSNPCKQHIICRRHRHRSGHPKPVNFNRRISADAASIAKSSCAWLASFPISCRRS